MLKSLQKAPSRIWTSVLLTVRLRVSPPSSTSSQQANNSSETKSAMETLPNELYDAIFAYLTFDDLQRVRLVCHDFAAKAAPRLFENVSIWIQRDSLKMLHHSSGNENIPHHVKSLRIDLHLLPVETASEPETPDAWECLRHDRYCYPFIRSNPCEDEFKEAISDQTELEQSTCGVVLLAATFAQLPNLKSVEISNRGKFPFGSNFYPTCNPNGKTEREQDCGKLQLQYLIRAAAVVGEKCSLENLVIWDQGKTNPCPHSDMILLSSEDISLAQVAFRNVRHFTWHISFDSMNVEQHLIAQFLNTMPALERFDFSQPSQARSPHWPLAFMNAILLDANWKNLRAIRFCNFRFSIDTFMQFACRHAASLKYLEIDHLFLREGPLKTFLRRIRKSFRLERFVLKGDIMTARGALRRNYMIGRDDGGFWYPTGELEGGKTEEEWHNELIGEIGEFVTRKLNVYPSKKLAAINESAPDWGGGESDIDTDEDEDEDED